jgi:hypothetical protein
MFGYEYKREKMYCDFNGRILATAKIKINAPPNHRELKS